MKNSEYKHTMIMVRLNYTWMGLPKMSIQMIIKVEYGGLGGKTVNPKSESYFNILKWVLI